jgi:hypothetical protein
VSALAYALVALAAYRLTRVVTTDSISLAARDRLFLWAWDDTDEIVVARAPWRTYVYELFTCSWCLGVWVSAAVYSAWRWWDAEAVRAVIAVFAVAGAQGFLASRRDA